MSSGAAGELVAPGGELFALGTILDDVRVLVEALELL